MVPDPENIREAAEELPQQTPTMDLEQGNPILQTREAPLQGRAKEQGQNSKETSKDPEVEEGEVSSDCNSEEESDTDITPKKTSRGRKTKKAEREKETYRYVLSGSQPTIRQLISVKQTQKQSRAPQGAHNSPLGNQ
jgi:hypothetical protein